MLVGFDQLSAGYIENTSKTKGDDGVVLKATAVY